MWWFLDNFFSCLVCGLLEKELEKIIPCAVKYSCSCTDDVRDSYNICDDKRDRIQTSGGACKYANCVQFNSLGSLQEALDNHCCRHSWMICIPKTQLL